MDLGFLHPGNMGVAMAAAAISAGHRVWWASEGRSDATRGRAEAASLEDARTVARLCEASDIIVSICPPAAAEDVARGVADQPFRGVYVDANAISPERMRAVASIVEAAGARAVDGGITGAPPTVTNSTTLHLSGPDRAVVAECFVGTVLGVEEHGDEIGTASALKMVYAGLTKGSAALLSAVIAAAEELGVREALYRQWDADEPGSAERREMTPRRVTAKAWRFAAELEEIAHTLESVGLPGGFHEAGAEVYRRLADLKDGPHPSDLDAVLDRLAGRQP